MNTNTTTEKTVNTTAIRYANARNLIDTKGVSVTDAVKQAGISMGTYYAYNNAKKARKSGNVKRSLTGNTVKFSQGRASGSRQLVIDTDETAVEYALRTRIALLRHELNLLESFIPTSSN